MADALMDKPNALVGLELAKLEKMHNGQEYFFTGFLTSGVVVVLRRAEGVSPAGRELWQLSLGRRKHAGAARPSGRAPRKD